MDNTALFFLIFNLSRHSQILDNLMIFATNYLIYLMVPVILVLGLKGGTREKKALLTAIVGLPVAFLFIKGIHLFLFEPRPFIAFHLAPLVCETSDASFPSRHATIISVIAFAYTYFKSKWSLAFLFMMLWIGLSRIYVGVHYPLDVIGGFIVGLISIIIAKQIFRFLKFGFLGQSL